MKRKVPRAALKRIIKGKKEISVSKNVDLVVSNVPCLASLVGGVEGQFGRIVRLQPSVTF